MVDEPVLRDAVQEDFPAILALNDKFVEHLSPMDSVKLDSLISMATYFRVIDFDGVVAGFLIAFKEGSFYESSNYQWFNERYQKFLYIDRIVIDEEYQGKKLAKRLYDDLGAFGTAMGCPFLACEYNIQPVNEASAKFHLAYGFGEVGTKFSDAAKRQVSLQRCSI